jgi:hypothetical protein
VVGCVHPHQFRRISKQKAYKICISQAIEFKGRDFGCFGLAKAEIAAWKKKKREQAPALLTQ